MKFGWAGLEASGEWLAQGPNPRKLELGILCPQVHDPGRQPGSS